MKQLDMVYLMKVSLHVKDMNDIQNIEMINKKCGNSIHSLKVNPWFTTEKDVNQFCRRFNPPTCNCNLLPVDETIIMKAENIINYKLDYFVKQILENDQNDPFNQEELNMTEEEKERLIKIIQKVVSMICFSYVSDEMIGIIIQNMKKGIKIRSNEMFAKKFDKIFDTMKIDESLYPSEIIFVGNEDGRWIKNPEKKNIIMYYYCQLTNDMLMNIPKSIQVYSTRIIIPETNNESNIKSIRTSVDLLCSNVTPNNDLLFKGSVNIRVNTNDINNEESRKKVYQIINNLYANSLTIYDNRIGMFGQNEKLTVFEVSQLPECINHISILPSNSKLIMNNKHIEYLEMSGQRSSLELHYINNLKQLKLHGNEIKINEMNEEQRITTNKRRYWKEIQENITTFQNLEEIQLVSCSNLNINLVANKLKNIEIVNCRECQISVKTESIERMKLERNKLTQFKITTNKSPDICIKECENFKTEIESKNEQDIDIIEGNNIEVKTKGNEKCNSLKVVDSTINEIDVKPKKVFFKSNEEYIKVPLKEAEEIYIVSMNDYIFEELFDKCKKLYIDECENCQFIVKKNAINEMKITRCKNTEITGKLDNLDEITTIDNEGCSIPETKKNIKEDREIIDMNNEKKDIEIETYKKHVIIRNANDSRIKIQSDINSDITIENSVDIIIEGEYEEYGNIQFNNCKSSNHTQCISEKTISKIGCAKTILINKFENNYFRINKIKNSLEVIDSNVGITVSSMDFNSIIDTIHIENSELYSSTSIESCNKATIINSTEIHSIIQHCKDELILKRVNDIRFTMDEDLKKVEMEECNLIEVVNDVKGKEVKLIKCHNMKIVDTSNSIKQIECDNVKVITEQQNEMMGRF
ncbi:hypothetical protein ENUP19_0136G0013 [Entamoeba nuttalli]|uniref:Leucine-rich repeat containing protein n=1 Tax=Entamoeba nuttalli TaxID=412467 RepID=A0ABQ0DJZ3_9EUKA